MQAYQLISFHAPVGCWGNVEQLQPNFFFLYNENSFSAFLKTFYDSFHWNFLSQQFDLLRKLVFY